MLTTTGLILLLILFFTGIGMFFPWSVFRRMGGLDHLFASFWTGWVLVIGFLQIWHLFLPVSLAAQVILVMLSLGGWFLARGHALDGLKQLRQIKVLLLTLMAVIPALVVANHVMFIAPHFDHGLYHMQTVKWISNFAIVPGLGNLHHRLAFNNSNLLTAALLNAGLLFGRSYYLSSTVLGVVVILQCATGIFKFFHPAYPEKKTSLYYALMTPFVIWQISTTHLPGYSPDIPVFALQVVLGGELLRLFEQELDKQQFAQQAALVILLAAAGMTVKMSFAVFGVMVLLIVFVAQKTRFQFNFKQDGKEWLKWLVPAGVLLATWVIRSIILTGYPVFPSSILPLPLAWKMPKDLVDQAAGVITIWARTRSDTIPYTGDWAWFQNWFRLFVFEVKVGFILAFLVAVLDLCLFVWQRRRHHFDFSPLFLFGLSLVSIIFWFVMAPDYRFSGGSFWILLVSSLLFGYELLTTCGWVMAPRFLALAILLGLTIWINPNQFSKDFSPKWLINPVSEQDIAKAAMDKIGISQTQLPNGLTVYYSLGTTAECWDAPLPCAPKNDIYPGLSLFEPGNLQKGFYISGNHP